MVTKILKVVAQTQAVYVPSKKSDNGQLAKSMIRLKELGGDYEDEYICAMFGNLALCKFAAGSTDARIERLVLPGRGGNRHSRHTSIKEITPGKMNTLIVNLQQTMTSLEIAELTGKQHFHVMEAIRKMEPAWKKVCKSNFRLTSRTIVQPNGGTREVPCYQLTKTECLYIATKFNDEARAKLVLRWEELEMADVRGKMADVRGKMADVRGKMAEGRCLSEPKKILALADDIIGEALRQLNAGAEDTLTATQVAKTCAS